MDAAGRERATGFTGTLHPAAFVGREREFGALDAALDRAVRFRAPQVVTVVGAVGAGKTRLLAEWLAEVAGPGLRVVRIALAMPGLAAPAPSGGNLIGALLRQRFGIGPQLGVEASLVQFRGEMQRVFADRRVAEVAALLADDARRARLSEAMRGLARPDAARDVADEVLALAGGAA